jgi:hypothetical protein
VKLRVIILVVIAVFIWGSACGSGLVMFNFQGEVSVDGVPFTGTGYFKFAIVNNLGTVSLWSNDGTSFNGEEPVTSVSVAVNGGVFNVMLGDPNLGMEPINSVIFNHPNQLRLRIWFDDGEHGFQQLVPDRRIVNPQLMGILTGTEDFTIFVDCINGDDRNNGLTTATAKKTIQSAVDILPARLRCNVTVDIADGVYREEVKLFGITAELGKSLILLGDETCFPGAVGEPAVRVTGNDNETTGTRVREFGIWAQKCSNVMIKGIVVDNATRCGVWLALGLYSVDSCKVSENVSGYVAGDNSSVVFCGCVAEQNEKDGFYVVRNSTGSFTKCEAKNNGWGGVGVNILSAATFYESGDFSNNGYRPGPSGSSHNGITVNHNSKCVFSDGYSGEIRNNAEYGLRVRYDAYAEDHTKNAFSGNGISDVQTEKGGHLYF